MIRLRKKSIEVLKTIMWSQIKVENRTELFSIVSNDESIERLKIHQMFKHRVIYIQYNTTQTIEELT